MRVSILVAIAANGVIGREGKLPWHLPDDLKRFREITMGHPVIMGRRTWESIARPLPGRQMIVVSRQPGYDTGVEGIHVASSLDEALEIARLWGSDEAFVIGGAELYREALPRADRLYLTLILAQFEGDTFFPKFDLKDWVPAIKPQMHQADAKHAHLFSFSVFRRIKPNEGSEWRGLWDQIKYE
jgi:dihydrofolate reductase